MAVDDLAPCVAMSSEVIVLIMQYKQALVFQEEEFQLPSSL